MVDPTYYVAHAATVAVLVLAQAGWTAQLVAERRIAAAGPEDSAAATPRVGRAQVFLHRAGFVMGVALLLRAADPVNVYQLMGVDVYDTISFNTTVLFLAVATKFTFITIEAAYRAIRESAPTRLFAVPGAVIVLTFAAANAAVLVRVRTRDRFVTFGALLLWMAFAELVILSAFDFAVLRVLRAIRMSRRNYEEDRKIRHSEHHAADALRLQMDAEDARLDAAMRSGTAHAAAAGAVHVESYSETLADSPRRAEAAPVEETSVSRTASSSASSRRVLLPADRALNYSSSGGGGGGGGGGGDSADPADLRAVARGYGVASLDDEPRRPEGPRHGRYWNAERRANVRRAEHDLRRLAMWVHGLCFAVVLGQVITAVGTRGEDDDAWMPDRDAFDFRRHVFFWMHIAFMLVSLWYSWVPLRGVLYGRPDAAPPSKAQKQQQQQQQPPQPQAVAMAPVRGRPAARGLAAVGFGGASTAFARLGEEPGSSPPSSGRSSSVYGRPQQLAPAQLEEPVVEDYSPPPAPDPPARRTPKPRRKLPAGQPGSHSRSRSRPRPRPRTGRPGRRAASRGRQAASRGAGARRPEAGRVRTMPAPLSSSSSSSRRSRSAGARRPVRSSSSGATGRRPAPLRKKRRPAGRVRDDPPPAPLPPRR